MEKNKLMKGFSNEYFNTKNDRGVRIIDDIQYANKGKKKIKGNNPNPNISVSQIQISNRNATPYLKDNLIHKTTLIDEDDYNTLVYNNSIFGLKKNCKKYLDDKNDMFARVCEQKNFSGFYNNNRNNVDKNKISLSRNYEGKGEQNICESDSSHESLLNQSYDERCKEIELYGYKTNKKSPERNSSSYYYVIMAIKQFNDLKEERKKMNTYEIIKNRKNKNSKNNQQIENVKQIKNQRIKFSKRFRHKNEIKQYEYIINSPYNRKMSQRVPINDCIIDNKKISFVKDDKKSKLIKVPMACANSSNKKVSSRLLSPDDYCNNNNKMSKFQRGKPQLRRNLTNRDFALSSVKENIANKFKGNNLQNINNLSKIQNDSNILIKNQGRPENSPRKNANTENNVNYPHHKNECNHLCQSCYLKKNQKKPSEYKNNCVNNNNYNNKNIVPNNKNYKNVIYIDRFLPTNQKGESAVTADVTSQEENIPQNQEIITRNNKENNNNNIIKSKTKNNSQPAELTLVDSTYFDNKDKSQSQITNINIQVGNIINPSSNLNYLKKIKSLKNMPENININKRPIFINTNIITNKSIKEDENETEEKKNKKDIFWQCIKEENKSTKPNNYVFHEIKSTSKEKMSDFVCVVNRREKTKNEPKDSLKDSFISKSYFFESGINPNMKLSDDSKVTIKQTMYYPIYERDNETQNLNGDFYKRRYLKENLSMKNYYNILNGKNKNI